MLFGVPTIVSIVKRFGEKKRSFKSVSEKCYDVISLIPEL
jgi:hypothetical protein